MALRSLKQVSIKMCHICNSGGGLKNFQKIVSLGTKKLNFVNRGSKVQINVNRGVKTAFKPKRYKMMWFFLIN